MIRRRGDLSPKIPTRSSGFSPSSCSLSCRSSHTWVAHHHRFGSLLERPFPVTDASHVLLNRSKGGRIVTLEFRRKNRGAWIRMPME